MKAAIVLLGLPKLCFALESIEQAVGRFNCESHLLFADPRARSIPCERLRVFAKDNVVVPELGLGNEIVIKALEDALEDFRTNYFGKKGGEWRRAIAAKERLVASTRWGIGLEKRQRAFLNRVVDLVFQHYERRALETGSEELKSRLEEVKRKRFSDNVPKGLEQTVFEGNGGTWGKYRQVLRRGGNVPPLMSVLGQRMFRKHVASRVPGIVLEQRGKNVVRISIAYLKGEQLGMIVRNLWWLSYLETAEIQWSGFSPPLARELAKSLECLRRLTTLDLSGNYVSDKGAIAIANGLAGMPNLKTLDLSRNSISATGAAAISSNLAGVSGLATLNLSRNEIKAAGARAIADGLASVPNLTSLDLSWNDLGDGGAAAISDGLTSAPSLAILNLSANKIGTAGAATIADRLGNVSSLAALDLSCNFIEATGAKAIADNLARVPSLTTLNLSFNNIGPKGAKAVADRLAKGPGLAALGFLRNLVMTGCAKRPAGATKLTTLDLSYNRIDDEDAAALASVLAKIPKLVFKLEGY